MDKYQVKNLIGDYLEGADYPSDPDFNKRARQYLDKVVSGPLETDDGLHRYYIDLNSLQLENIDLCEAIWPIGENESYQGDEGDIAFFDELAYGLSLEAKIVNSENGKEKLQSLKSKILDKLAEK